MKLKKAEEKWMLAGELGKLMAEKVGTHHGKVIVNDEGNLEEK